MLDRETRVIEMLKKLYPADNDLGFDLGKIIPREDELQKARQTREELDIVLKQEGKDVIL